MLREQSGFTERAELAIEQLRITLLRSLGPRQVEVLDLAMPVGSTVSDALGQSGWSCADSASSGPCVGVWGKLQPLDHELRDLDRVEVYRSLRVDPKQARRERYAAHQAKHPAAKRVRRGAASS